MQHKRNMLSERRGHVHGQRTRMSACGMTLLETMFAVSIMTIVVGTLMALGTVLGDTARVQEEKTAAFDEARRALTYMVRDLRQAARSSLSDLPFSDITYQVAADLDGNGSAVDMGGSLELTALRTIARDVEDLNGDGLTDSQLVLAHGDTVMVLCNRLMTDEDINENGELDDGEDANDNGEFDRGIWFEQVGGSVMVGLQTYGRSRQGHLLTTSVTATVYPRN